MAIDATVTWFSFDTSAPNEAPSQVYGSDHAERVREWWDRIDSQKKPADATQDVIRESADSVETSDHAENTKVITALPATPQLLDQIKQGIDAATHVIPVVQSKLHESMPELIDNASAVTRFLDDEEALILFLMEM
ncbi:hypothetical protein ACO0K3_03710 [Undibacterium sp. Rencai35W]|uniref:hypothetical protein n=1 Tax=Undibacterium sp. Rencai35W TaxID=3413046 RepID=UPI003BF113F5